MDFYNLVSKKFTLIINKTIMTYGKESPITTETNLRHRENALRVFITGLNGTFCALCFPLILLTCQTHYPECKKWKATNWGHSSLIVLAFLNAALTKIQELYMTHTINLTTTIRAIICVWIEPMKIIKIIMDKIQTIKTPINVHQNNSYQNNHSYQPFNSYQNANSYHKAITFTNNNNYH